MQYKEITNKQLEDASLEEVYDLLGFSQADEKWQLRKKVFSNKETLFVIDFPSNWKTDSLYLYASNSLEKIDLNEKEVKKYIENIVYRIILGIKRKEKGINVITDTLSYILGYIDELENIISLPLYRKLDFIEQILSVMIDKIDLNLKIGKIPIPQLLIKTIIKPIIIQIYKSILSKIFKHEISQKSII
jgi:hypothetical protein